MKRFGTTYGGFYYPNELNLGSSSVIYCVGAGEDISHDCEVAAATGATVHIFDPTPRAITHVQYIKDLLDGRTSKTPSTRFGGGDATYLDRILSTGIRSEKLSFHEFGIGPETKDEVPFFFPSNPDYVSCSIVPGMKGTNSIPVKIKTLTDTMKLLGHTHIDLLKLDIEGSECDVLDEMLTHRIRPKYLGIDFDLGYTGEKIRDIGRCNSTVAALKETGYVLLKEIGPDKSFMLI